VRGCVSHPTHTRRDRRHQYYFINGRPIVLRPLPYALEEAYRGLIMTQRYPMAAILIELPGEMVDVNVHPAKAEVRFRDRWQVERTLETAVRRALGTFEAGATFGRGWTFAPTPTVPAAEPPGLEALRHDATVPGGLFENAREAAWEHSPNEALPSEQEEVAAVDATAGPSPEVPLLQQWRRTYIAFEHEQGVVLIDQHSAHERVLYEAFMQDLELGAASGQRLLFPLTLHLGPAEAEAFDRNRELFERLGFDIESFGGHTLLVRAVPMPHPRFDAERCVRETLATLTGDREAGVHARHERLAATVACKAAIKAGEALSSDEMRALFIALRDTTLPAHDVHGRATIVQLTWDEIERRFGRR